MSRVRKFRGIHTHGKGTHKNRRGGGSRGGRGRSGGDKHHYLLYGIHWGKHGFIRHNHQTQTVVNLRDLEAMARRMEAEGKLQRQEGALPLDLGALGIDKVVGMGKPRLPLAVKGGALTPGAKASIEAAGGKVIAS